MHGSPAVSWIQGSVCLLVDAGSRALSVCQQPLDPGLRFQAEPGRPMPPGGGSLSVWYQTREPGLFCLLADRCPWAEAICLSASKSFWAQGAGA
jgi:hypothetical protein